MKSVGSRLCGGIFVGLLAGSSFAGAGAGFFVVSIGLTNSGFLAPSAPDAPVAAASVLGSGVCISEALSRQARALVRVLCGAGQFVSIVPMPGKPFLGVHGGVFRYSMSAVTVASAPPSDADNPYRATGAVTALSVFRTNASTNDPGGPLEMLVSF